MPPNPELQQRKSSPQEAVDSDKTQGRMDVTTTRSHSNKTAAANSSNAGSNKKPKAQGRRLLLRQQQKPRPTSMSRCIPNYLKPFVHPFHGDFCCSRHFHPQLITQIMAEGFLPMCSSDGILLPKLHQQRSCIQFHAADGGLHTSKSVRKKANKYAITWNQNWEEVVDACRQQHGVHCWLYKELVESFHTIHKQAKQQEPYQASLAASRGENVKIPVRVHSIELWAIPPTSDGSKKQKNKQKNKNKQKSGETAMDQDQEENGCTQKQPMETEPERRLVAGELGYSCGAVYTSLTGFTRESSAGSVQLSALGSALQQASFEVWDLGMAMEYKTALGANLLTRDQFLNLLHQHRLRSEVDLSSLIRSSNNTPNNDETLLNARSLIDAAASSRRS